MDTFLTVREHKALAAFVESGAFGKVVQRLEMFEAEAMVTAARAADWKEQRRAGMQTVAIRDFRQAVELLVQKPELTFGGGDGEAA